MPLLYFTLLALVAPVAAAGSPNIVFVVTDDQGYGDLQSHGHPYLKTPHLDQLAGESIRLDDFHMGTTCSPSRASLMTGRWSNHVGVWHTVRSRSNLRGEAVTVAEMLTEAGYRTGLFGKWHLGDTYPYRPEDQGFQEVFGFQGGAISFVSDLWNNAYFNDRFLHKGATVQAEGFCTDVLFDQAMRFVRESVDRDEPFFAYIATNAPHAPLHAPESYLELYEGHPQPAFYGMISNIDDNVGRIRARLEEMGIADETIFIYTSDNGTGRGKAIYNAGMRGGKGSPYDGGHRVPFFLHWPGGGMDAERRVGMLTHVVDLAPTLLDLVGFEAPAEARFDGLSLRPLLERGDTAEWPDRMVVSDTQRVIHPVKWRRSAVMAPGWRLVNGDELYYLPDDPGQQKNIAGRHPERVKAMRAFYENWWSGMDPGLDDFAGIFVGHPAAPPIVTLYPREWIAHDDARMPITQGHIREAKVGGPRANPTWPIQVVEDGIYRVSAHRWPPEINHPINAALPPEPPVPGTDPTARAFEGRAIQAREAVLSIDGAEKGRIPVDADLRSADFTLPLEAGAYRVNAHFILEDADLLNAYYLTVEKLGQ